MQAYKVAADMREPCAIYAGLQDHGTIGTMSFTRDVFGVRNDAAWKLHWDDGQYVAVDPRDWRMVYSEGTQASFRVVDPIGHTDTRREVSSANIVNFKDVAPASDGSSPLSPLRFNWTSPYIISPHNPDVLYYGSNYLLKSTDKGVTWGAISKDLSKHDPSKNQVGTGGITSDASGAEGYATVFSVSESPVAKGTIWAGTNDGNVWLTRNEGVIIGTHGRGIYILDDISTLEQWQPTFTTAAAHLFEQRLRRCGWTRAAVGNLATTRTPARIHRTSNRSACSSATARTSSSRR